MNILTKFTFLLLIIILLFNGFIYSDIHDKSMFNNQFYYLKHQKNNLPRNDFQPGSRLLLTKKTNDFFVIDSITAHRTTGMNTKHTMEYDDSGNKITELWQEFYNNEYTNFYRNSFSYDNGQLINALEERWDQGQWKKISLTTYHYTSFNNPDTILFSIWENEEWINNARQIYTYQADSIIATYSIETWRNGSWSLYRKDFYQYQDNLLMNHIYHIWENELILFSIQYTYQYGQENQIIYRIRKTAIDSVWGNSDQIFYQYDSSGLCVSDSMEEWNEDHWKKRIYNLYAYDEYGNKISETRQYWNEQWIKTVQNTYEHDINGNTTSQLRKNWQENQWVNDNLRNYDYDENSNLFHLTYQTWEDSVWVPNDAGLLIFTDYNNTDYQFYAAEVSIYPRLFTNMKEPYYSNVFLSLSNNYPNPFSESTKITYSIPRQGFVELKIYDLLGREIKTLVQEEQAQGSHEITLQGKKLASGIYFYKLRVNQHSLTKKMFHIK